MLQLLELGPKIEFWQRRAKLWASPGPTTSAVGWSRAGVKGNTDSALCPLPLHHQGTGVSAPGVP